MARCEKCGKIITDGSRYCPYCGGKVTVDSSPWIRPEPRTPTPASSPRPVAGETGSGDFWIGILKSILSMILIIPVFAGAILIFIGIGSDGGAERTILIIAGIVIPIVAVLLCAGGMVALDAAANIRRCASNSAYIFELLKSRK